MADRAERAHVAAIVASVAVRGRAEQTRLTAMLRRSCWPGAGDRTDPAAREWLRHWGPQGIALSGPGCTCAAGRCMVCN